MSDLLNKLQSNVKMNPVENAKDEHYALPLFRESIEFFYSLSLLFLQTSLLFLQTSVIQSCGCRPQISAEDAELTNINDYPDDNSTDEEENN